jgi:uncharacterized protein YbaP (TraB family)
MIKNRRKKMKNNLLRFIVILLLLLTAASAGAESSVWVLKSPKATIYFAGSCHVLRASDYPLPPEFDIAYRDSRKIIFEASQDEMAGAEFQAKLLSASIYDDGTTLKQHLSSKAYAKAEAFCKKRNYQIEALQMLRPWMFAMMLTMQEMQKLGAEPNYGIDYFFNEKAHRDGKTIDTLETVDEQIGFLTMLDKGTDNEQIIETIDELEQINIRLADIVNAWRKGDERKTEELSLQDLKNYPKLYNVLITDRNLKWVKKIEGYLQKPEKIMIIVGAAHLVGDNGVIELLKKRGYPVEKLKK